MKRNVKVSNATGIRKSPFHTAPKGVTIRDKSRGGTWDQLNVCNIRVGGVGETGRGSTGKQPPCRFIGNMLIGFRKGTKQDVFYGTSW